MSADLEPLCRIDPHLILRLFQHDQVIPLLNQRKEGDIPNKGSGLLNPYADIGFAGSYLASDAQMIGLLLVIARD